MHQKLHPSTWKKASGYANGIEAPAGRTLFLGGQIGWTRSLKVMISLNRSARP